MKLKEALIECICIKDVIVSKDFDVYKTMHWRERIAEPCRTREKPPNLLRVGKPCFHGVASMIKTLSLGAIRPIRTYLLKPVFGCVVLFILFSSVSFAENAWLGQPNGSDGWRRDENGWYFDDSYGFIGSDTTRNNDKLHDRRYDSNWKTYQDNNYYHPTVRDNRYRDKYDR